VGHNVKRPAEPMAMRRVLLRQDIEGRGNDVRWQQAKALSLDSTEVDARRGVAPGTACEPLRVDGTMRA
jgi:hypothetical protein